MTRRLNRFHRPSLDPRPWLSTVANLKLAAARAGRFAAIVLTATATLLLAGIGTAPAHAATRLTISPLVLVFPEQEVGTTSTAKNVTLTNPNASALQINTVTPSGDFTLSSDGCTGTLLAPAAKCIVSVVFTPSQTGTRTGTLTIADGAFNSPQTVSLSGKGILVKPTFSPTHLTFGNVPVDVPSAPQTITLTNPNWFHSA